MGDRGMYRRKVEGAATCRLMGLPQPQSSAIQLTVMWVCLLVCGLLAGAFAQKESPSGGGKVYRGQVVPKYWRAIDGTVHKDLTSKGEQYGHDSIYPDKLQVISSSLRILPKKPRRQRRSESTWRKPREYQFVTRDKERDSTTSSTRSARLVDQNRSSSNYYQQERPYYNRGDDYFNRRSGVPPNRRIIYYATLPEVIRRPGEWTPPRPIYNPSGYPSIRDNEITRVRSPVIDVTRVQSSVIDVTDKNRFNAPYSQDLPTPKFTIIDAEPPYNRPRPPPQPAPVYDSSRYDRGRYDSMYDRNRYDQNRYNYNRYDYNRYDYRNYVEPPYRYYDEPRLPPQRHQVLPPQPITVVRKPLDVRPLDPIRDLTTQAPPSSSTTTSSPSTSSTSNPISSFERTFKF